MVGKIITHKIEERFRSCPTCGYRDGFHSAFEKEDDIVKWLLICPSCHDLFDIGLQASLRASEQKT